MIVYYVPPWWQGAKSQQIYYCVVQYSICTYLVTIHTVSIPVTTTYIVQHNYIV